MKALMCIPATLIAQQSPTPPQTGDGGAQDAEEREVSRPPTPEDLAGLRDIGGPFRGAISVSPDGRWVAFQLQEPDLRSNEIRLTWVAVRADDPGDVRLLGDGGELNLNPTMHFVPNSRQTVRGTWAPGSQALYYLKKVDGETGVWRSRIGTGVQEPVIQTSADVIDFRFSRDGRSLIYSLARPRADLAAELREEGLRGFLVDDRMSPDKNTSRPIRLICDADVTFFSLERGCDPEIRALDLTSGEDRLASSEERTILEAPFTTSSSDREVRARLSTDALVYGCSMLADRAICLHESPTTPMKIVVVDLSLGSMVSLYDPNPEWREVELTTVERFEWTDPFGNSRRGHLVYPRGFEEGVRYPLVITPYLSSGFLRGDLGDEYPIHLFAAAGMMVLDVEGLLMVDARNLERVPMDFAGLVAAVDLLDDKGLIDRDRIGMGGLSYASLVTNYALINSDLLQAAVTSVLTSPEAEYYLGSAFIREMLSGDRVFGGAPFGGSEYYDRLSLAWNADRVSAPILVNVSDHEFTLSVPALAALQDAGKGVEMHVFPDEYHQKWQPVHLLNIYRRNAQWFEFWLLDRVDPEPVDPAQFERWRALR
jgi:dipeptidyl aminopeptidase/acylaminoacyl peptidase